MWRKEPVAVALAGADAVVVSVLSALVAVGIINLSGEQLAAISAAIVAVTGFVGAILRANVVSPATYETDIADAIAVPEPSAPTSVDDLRGYLGGDA